MTQTRQRSPGEGGHVGTSDATRTTPQLNEITTHSSEHWIYFSGYMKAKFRAPAAGSMRRPPSVAPLARARHAPNMILLHVGDDWADALADALHDLQRFIDPTPNLFLPKDQDPASYSWPVVNLHVQIIGEIKSSRLKRLIKALRRDGAPVVAGIDRDGRLHTASDRATRAVA